MTNAGDIRAWLAELGLAKYAEAFSSNAIDVDIVRELTEADLKDLGVEAMGDRKRLLRAIASLPTERMFSVAGAAAGPSPTDAEHRSLAGRMDPEDLREVISAYQKWVAETVRRFDTGLWRNTWATVSWCTSAIPRRMRMMPSARYGRDWS